MAIRLAAPADDAGEGSEHGVSELARFLRAKREQMRLESVGLRVSGRRRVPGLRRDEMAMLSGISTEYYVLLEQGRDENPSTQVLEALARALRLDEEATAHLYRLSRPLPEPPATQAHDASTMVAGLIELWPATPAFIADRHGNVLAANSLARLLSPAYRSGVNLLRVLFLDPVCATSPRTARGCSQLPEAQGGPQERHRCGLRGDTSSRPGRPRVVLPAGLLVEPITDVVAVWSQPARCSGCRSWAA